MKIAVIGSRSVQVPIERYLPKGITLLVSGGANGVDTLAEQYANRNGIPTLIIRPDYALFGRRAPLIRNEQIVNSADCVVALWDGKSRGTLYTINYARSLKKPLRLYLV